MPEITPKPPQYEVERQAPTEQKEAYEFLTLFVFLETYHELRPELVDGMLREGETLNIIAASKIGKSWLTMLLAMCVATGSDFLGRSTFQQPVLYIDNELHPETLAWRLEALSEAYGFDMDLLNENFVPICVRGLRANAVELENIIEQSIVKPKLIVLDAWYRFLPAGTTENDNAQMMQLYNLLDAYARQFEAAFIVVHHSAKGNQSNKSITDVGSGAGAMSRAADGHLTIRDHKDEGLYVLEGVARSFPPIDAQSIRLEFPVWQLDDATPELRRSTRNNSQADVQKLIENLPKEFHYEFNFGDAKKALGDCGDSRARKAIKAGESSGDFAFVCSKKRKHSSKATPHYCIVDKGIKEASERMAKSLEG